jgi:hypothetical protein
LIDNRGSAFVVTIPVLTAGKIQHLKGFHSAGSRIGGIGPNAGPVIDLESGNFTVRRDRDAGVYSMIASMNV